MSNGLPPPDPHLVNYGEGVRPPKVADDRPCHCRRHFGVFLDLPGVTHSPEGCYQMVPVQARAAIADTATVAAERDAALFWAGARQMRKDIADGVARLKAADLGLTSLDPLTQTQLSEAIEKFPMPEAPRR